MEDFFFGADHCAVRGDEIDVVCDRLEEVEHAVILPAAAGAETDTDLLEVTYDFEIFGADLVGSLADKRAVDVTCD